MLFACLFTSNGPLKRGTVLADSHPRGFESDLFLPRWNTQAASFLAKHLDFSVYTIARLKQALQSAGSKTYAHSLPGARNLHSTYLIACSKLNGLSTLRTEIR